MKQDVAVIGGGPAGYVAAIKAAQLGGSVVLFERSAVGGTCLNRGCIPTKTYLKTAEYLHHIRSAKDRGIVMADSAATVDMPKVVAYKDRVVKVLTGGVAALLKANGVEMVQGDATLVSPTEVSCGGEIYKANKIILCGGSMAGKPPIPGIGHPAVLTSDELLDLATIPERLCVIGGGVIGCEMACAFRAFGSAVTIVELADRILPGMDGEVSEAMKKALSKQGVKIFTSRQVLEISGPDTTPVVSTDGGDFSCDTVLLSIGRVADRSCLGTVALETQGGKVVVNDHMETSVPGVYACGDLVDRVMLAHAAFKMGETAAENCMGGDARCDLTYVPSCVYTLPEASAVGMTEVQAVAYLGAERVAVGRFPFSANGRATASGERVGFVKVLTDRETGVLLGVHMVGEMAAELIAEPTTLLSCGITAAQVADSVIHGHPTYSEAIMEACADALGRCLHLPPRT